MEMAVDSPDDVLLRSGDTQALVRRCYGPVLGLVRRLAGDAAAHARSRRIRHYAPSRPLRAWASRVERPRVAALQPAPAKGRRDPGRPAARSARFEEDPMAVKPVPDGYHTVTPYLSVRGASDAIAFYVKAFAATEILRLPGPDGKLGHA